jgi:hypothetical protein
VFFSLKALSKLNNFTLANSINVAQFRIAQADPSRAKRSFCEVKP